MSNVFDSWQKIFITIFLSFLAIFGFLGNVIVWITFSTSKITNRSMSALIVNLSVADMLQCLNLVFIITATNDIAWYKTHTWCQLNGFTNVTFLGTSLLSLTLISINRYFVIVKHSKAKIFTWRNTLLFIFFAWLYSLILAVGPLAGWSKYTFSRAACFCLGAAVIRQGDISYISYTVVAIGTLVILPFTVLCFCTWKILITLKRSRQRVEEDISSMSARHEEERRITVILLVIILTFVTFNIPGSIVITLGTLNYQVEPWIGLLAMVIMMINHANNPVIYGLMNRNFRKAISKAFSRNRVRNTLRVAPARNDHP